MTTDLLFDCTTSIMKLHKRKRSTTQKVNNWKEKNHAGFSWFKPLTSHMGSSNNKWRPRIYNECRIEYRLINLLRESVVIQYFCWFTLWLLVGIKCNVILSFTCRCWFSQTTRLLSTTFDFFFSIVFYFIYLFPCSRICV